MEKRSLFQLENQKLDPAFNPSTFFPFYEEDFIFHLFVTYCGMFLYKPWISETVKTILEENGKKSFD